MTFYSYLKQFTKAYKDHEHDDVSLREAYCIRVMHQYEFTWMEPGDLLVGRKRVVPVGFSNEPLLGRSVCWFYDEARAMEALKAEGAGEERIAEAKELLAFWAEHETRKRLRAEYPEETKEAMPEDIYWEHSQIAFPLYRVVGAYLDYEKLLRLGIGGLRDELKARMEALPEGESPAMLQACSMALDSLALVCLHYGDLCENRGRKPLSRVLYKIAIDAPETFLEAMQLSWLYSLISGVLNYGRMDDYLGDFLARDLENGTLTPEEAQALTTSLWRLIDARKTVFHGRVIIGGKGRHNEKNADRFAMLAMEASRIVAEPEPQLSLRFYDGQDPALMEKALQVIGEGKVYPMLYNDDVNIPSVMKAFHLDEKEAEDYCFFGCGEYVINHRSMGSPNGIINLLKALEVTLFNGEDLRDKKPLGLKLGALTDYETFEDLYNAYKQQLDRYFRILALQEQQEYDFCAKEGSFLYITMLMDDCLERNRSVCGGGVRYLGGTLETYGNINTTNSLYAIKDLVYDKKRISRETLMNAIRANFVGYEQEQALLQRAEKYGNDADGVDTLAKDLHEWICSHVSEAGKLTGMHSYLIVIINNEANTVLGRFTWASADGRKAGEPMANANNPAGGTDRCGITAMMNSLVKLRTDIHAGAVQNMAFSKELFAGEHPIAEPLLKTYFANGGQQAMINVLNRGDLEDAMLHPERHQGLLVRVGGFSARFVTLSPDVQREIASRTLY